MGGHLVSVAIIVALKAELEHAEARLLLGIANTALDGDKEPRYFASREALAILLGRFAPDLPNESADEYRAAARSRANAFRAVDRALGPLVERKLLERTRAAPGRRANYTIPRELWEAIAFGTVEPVAKATNERRSASDDARRSASQSDDAQRPERTTLNVAARRALRNQRRKRAEEEDRDPAQPQNAVWSPVDNREERQAS